MVIIFVLASIVALAVIALLLTAIFANRKYFRRRYDGNPNLKYFTADDFHQLVAEPISFPSDKGQVLRGYIYRSSQVPAEGLIIFSHGSGRADLWSGASFLHDRDQYFGAVRLRSPCLRRHGLRRQ